MGNCYSLQKDHESALKFFQRAIHLDSTFTYAHTLCGHEYASLFFLVVVLLMNYNLNFIYLWLLNEIRIYQLVYSFSRQIHSLRRF